MKSLSLLIATLVLTAGTPGFAATLQNTNSSLEADGRQALTEIGFNPELFSARAIREVSLLRSYQKAWNDFNPAVTDVTKIANPQRIVDNYTDQSGLLYRDMCVPNGIKSKPDFLKYLSLLYSKFPRQVWGDGWKNIHLFPGSAPGEWAYYYEFVMYKSLDPAAQPALAGTGMERVTFDENGKLMSDEVHLIINNGTATCKF